MQRLANTRSHTFATYLGAVSRYVSRSKLLIIVNLIKSSTYSGTRHVYSKTRRVLYTYEVNVYNIVGMGSLWAPHLTHIYIAEVKDGSL